MKLIYNFWASGETASDMDWIYFKIVTECHFPDLSVLCTVYSTVQYSQLPLYSAVQGSLLAPSRRQWQQQPASPRDQKRPGDIMEINIRMRDIYHAVKDINI